MLQDDEVKNDCAGLFPTHEENIYIINLCCYVAKSDGNLTDAEESVLNQVCDFLRLNSGQHSDCKYCYSDWSPMYQSDGLIARLQKMPKRHRVLTVDLLRMVAEADGAINFWEEYFISAVKEKLNV